MRLMSKGEYLIVPKGTKFTGSGKLGLKPTPLLLPCHYQEISRTISPLIRLFAAIGQVLPQTL